ncbi:hypothetical protein BDAP_002088 [Binucleata daphniae]
MLTFLFFVCFNAKSISIFYDQSEPNLKIEEEIIEHQICQGYFHPFTSTNCTFEVSITSQDKKLYYFYKDKLALNEETHFSFNNIDPQVVLIEARPVSVDGLSLNIPDDLKLKYEFSYQFDTFNKDIAKDVRIQPTVQALTHLEKLMYEVYVQTEKRGEMLRKLSMQYNKYFKFVYLISFVTFFLVICMNIWQVYSIRRFFKKKKMI